MSRESNAPRFDFSKCDKLKETILAHPDLPVVFDIADVGYDDLCYPASCEIVWMLNVQTPYDMDRPFFDEDTFYNEVGDCLRRRYEAGLYEPDEYRLADEVADIVDDYEMDWVQVILVKLTNDA